MPVVFLEREFLDASGKAIALLFQIWLLVGPSHEEVVRFCRRVVCVVTDSGTERLVANFVDIVPDFYRCLGSPARGLANRPYLFDVASQSPGWMHAWDIVLKRSLSSLRWFPSFLDKMRAVVSVFRVSTQVSQVVRHLRDNLQLPVVADMIASITVPSIAEWRWGSLWLALQALDGRLDTLRDHFEFRLWNNAKDPVKVRKCQAAFTSMEWRWQFEFVLWLCSWICRIQQWGKGCSVHGDACPDGCRWKGRRLKEAAAYVSRKLRRGLEEANSWTMYTFGTTQGELIDLQRCARAAFVIGHKKTEYLRKIPVLFCRLFEDGVKDMILAQWASCRPDKHHKLSRHFMLPGPLRRDFDALVADGTGASELLQMNVEGVAAMPMDDSIAETPHSTANRTKKVARAAKSPWLGASMRLKQNLDDVPEWTAALDVDVKEEWCRYTSILQRDPRRQHRSMRISQKRFQGHLYKLGFFLGPTKKPDLERDRLADEDPHGDPPLPPPPPPGDDGSDDGEGGEGDGDEDDGGDGPHDVVALAAVAAAAREVQEQRDLMRDFMLACIAPSMFLSVPRIEEGGEEVP